MARFINYSSKCPYKNIAYEEALFKSVIDTRIPVIRIWKNFKPCIYLGIGGKEREEVFIKKCRKDKIPVIKRFSGGGTVLHAKGNLNFTLILPLEKFPKFENIHNSYLEIFKILQSVFKPYKLSFNGSSDICINNKKISGNAQARRKNTLLHHGTILFDMDTNLINKYLRHPKDMPEYRKDKKHEDFITTLKKEKIQINQKEFILRFQSCINKFYSHSILDMESKITTFLKNI